MSWLSRLTNVFRTGRVNRDLDDELLFHIDARTEEFVRRGGRNLLQRRLCMASVQDRVKEIIVEQLGVEEAEVTPSASFVDDLGADSLDIVELVMAFEEAFDIEIPDEDAEKITTVGDAVNYIDDKTKA